MDILSLVNEAGAPDRGAVVMDTIELAAFLALLPWRTRNRTVRAKHAAIACERLQSLAAALAVIEELAGVGRHGLNGLMAALRASKR
jgi:hypothetical protein